MIAPQRRRRSDSKSDVTFNLRSNVAATKRPNFDKNSDKLMFLRITANKPARRKIRTVLNNIISRGSSFDIEFRDLSPTKIVWNVVSPFLPPRHTTSRRQEPAGTLILKDAQVRPRCCHGGSRDEKTKTLLRDCRRTISSNDSKPFLDNEDTSIN